MKTFLIIMAFMAVLPDICAQGKRFAVTCLSANYLREAPDFTAELGSQTLMGTPVEITGEDGYWRKVHTPDPYDAWCLDLGLVEMEEEALAVYISVPKLIVIAEYSNVYESPDRFSDKISDLVMGDLLVDMGKSRNGFRKVSLPSGTVGYVRRKDTACFDRWADGTSAAPDRIVSAAMKFLGVPYLWGGTSIKGVDCSGFTKMVWFMNGMLIPRNASQQAYIGEEVEVEADFSVFPPSGEAPAADNPLFAAEMDKRVSLLEKGDLIFFGVPSEQPSGRDRISHVGIYIGDGKFIHSSRFVRISSLIPGSADYYELSYRMIRARRPGTATGNGIVRMKDSSSYFPQPSSVLDD